MKMESCSFTQDIMIGLITGIVSGLISSIIIYFVTKKREEKIGLYYYWRSFLFNALRECEMYIPVAELDKVNSIGDKDSRWHEAVTELLHNLNPYGHEDKEFDEHQVIIADNVMIAIEELEKWKKTNHIR